MQELEVDDSPNNYDDRNYDGANFKNANSHLFVLP